MNITVAYSYFRMPILVMKAKSYIMLFLASLVLVSIAEPFQSGQEQSATIGTRSYKISAIGSVEMSVPLRWEESVQVLEVPPAFTLAYRLPSVKDFYMKVTSAWEPQQERSARDPGWLRHVVEKTGQALGDKNPKLNEINGPSVKGYYLQVAHKERFPIGEFKYVVQGVVDLGKITVVFSVYSTKKELPELSEALRVIESARFVAAN